MKDELEKRLQTLLKLPASHDPDAVRHTVDYVRHQLRYRQRRISFWTFVWTQFTFIRKRIWGVQLAVVAGSWGALWRLAGEDMLEEALVLCSAAAPLLVLAAMFELTRSFVYRTAEIERSTRYSLEQLMLARAGMLGLASLCALTLLIASPAAASFAVPLNQLVLYAGVPFLAACSGCLWIINRWPSREGRHYCFLWGGGMSLSAGLMSYWFPDMYAAASSGVWALAFIVSLAGVTWEFRKLIRKCKTTALDLTIV
ncbi:hypothetical protein [Paenibacillus senegalensis]|uniref:hypothetical protein n=1 Tax=Paenibacillus senegalensis TaxID=1465766 RepID=UPI00028930D4|nr:hypothetical protein [Paenibacillus senegalensis]